MNKSLATDPGGDRCCADLLSVPAPRVTASNSHVYLEHRYGR
jgi:hypothetical protein